ncbi:MAG: exopolysaccharide biosynthesis polyprenyl glycosylphosphotransferase, partial [bacterium]|nr:exopolysaccharide biosynthesis polyprenyl glycosylphosphotransferase [bacterium]
PLGAAATLFGALLLAALFAHVTAYHLVRRIWMSGRLRASALIYGSDALARELAIEIGIRRDYGVDVVGFIANTRAIGHPLPGPVFDVGVDVVDIIERTGANRLIVGPGTASADRQAVRAARRAAATGMPVFVVPRFFEMGLGMDLLAPDRARGYPLIRLQRAAHPQVSIRLKRLFDLAVSLGMLLVTAPVIAIAAVSVKATSRGPVLYTQERVGQHGRPIVIRKFRSMTVSANGDTEWTADARVTLVGRWLRRLNIDELPQLYSVVRGDMSLVGPRPERPLFVKRFASTIADYDDRHRMPVGITGLAQIVGLRGDTSIAERIKYDNLYIDQWSF